jgi:tRNA pseudouridine38-40 synthase
MNAVLPCDVRVQGIKRVTKNFSSKGNCDARTYLYLLPTFAFSPVEAVVTEEYRIDEDKRAAVNQVLSTYVGTHYFHNYTSGK